MHPGFCSPGEGTTEWKRQRNWDGMCVCVTQCVFKKLKCILRLAIPWIKSAHAQIKPIAGCNNLVDRCEFCGKSTNFCAFQFHFFALSFYRIDVVFSLFYTRFVCCASVKMRARLIRWANELRYMVRVSLQFARCDGTNQVRLCRCHDYCCYSFADIVKDICAMAARTSLCVECLHHRHHNDVFDGKELFRHFIHQVKLTNSIEQCTHFSSLSRSPSVSSFLVTSLVRSWNFIYLMCPFQKSQTPNEKCPKNTRYIATNKWTTKHRTENHSHSVWMSAVSLCNGSLYTLIYRYSVAVHKINIFNAFFSKHSNFLTTASGMPLRFGGENNKYNFRWK